MANLEPQKSAISTVEGVLSFYRILRYAHFCHWCNSQLAEVFLIDNSNLS